MKVHNLTVCDQVRVEDNGKFLLIGVYTNGILLRDMPSHFYLNIWLLLEADQPGKRQFAFRAHMKKSGQQIFELIGDVDVVDVAEWIPMAFGGDVIISEPDEITIEAKFEGETDWSLLRTMHVKRFPALPVSA